jgi:hypothetical protein
MEASTAGRSPEVLSRSTYSPVASPHFTEEAFVPINDFTVDMYGMQGDAGYSPPGEVLRMHSGVEQRSAKLPLILYGVIATTFKLLFWTA